MIKALVTGATGTIGRRLVLELDAPRVLARSPERARGELGDLEAFRWSSDSDVPDAALEGVDAVFNLAGEPIAEGRWTAEKKARIRDSRVAGTRRLVSAIARAKRRPQVLVSGSAIGIYGSRGDEVLTEASAPGEGFLADVCRAWEEEAERATELGVRVVCARTGVVLAPEGGAMARMLPMFRRGLGGPLGSGEQWMSWIHLDDVVGILLHLARHADVSGPVNVVAPEPLTNREFARTLGRVVHRPARLPAPALALRLAFGEMSEVLLGSQRVLPGVASRSGYHFCFRLLEQALADVVGPPPPAASRRAGAEAHVRSG